MVLLLLDGGWLLGLLKGRLIEFRVDHRPQVLQGR
jgi:hypothetical protein